MKYLIGNWKMYLNHQESVDLAKAVVKQKKHKNITLAVCPSFENLEMVGKILKKTNILLGAQDAFWLERGAATGEISPKVLKELGCTYVILGHSERRAHFGETNAMIQKKLVASIEAKLVPILCVGETKRERDEGKARRVVMEQLEACLAGVPILKAKELLIAYEPIWAIGTGEAADVEEIVTMFAAIKKWLASQYPNLAIRKKIHLIYGGSVDSRNITSYLRENSIEGALIGGASIKSKEFAAMVDVVASLKL